MPRLDCLQQWHKAKHTKTNQMHEQMIEEAASHSPIIIESSVEDQFLIAKKNLIIFPRTFADIQPLAVQFLTSSVQLGEHFNVSFENLLLQTVTSNFTKIVKKRKRVATDAKVIISEETKLRLFFDKNKETTNIFFLKKTINYVPFVNATLGVTLAKKLGSNALIA